MLGYLFVQLVSKIFNLRGHDPPASKTDGQTDDMRSQDHALHCSASRGKNNDTTWLQYDCNVWRTLSMLAP